MPEGTNSYIYVVYAPDAGVSKIGHSVDPRARLGILRIGSPVPLELAYSYEVPRGRAKAIERSIHDMLLTRWSHGEWYVIAPDKAVPVVLLAAKRARARALA